MNVKELLDSTHEAWTANHEEAHKNAKAIDGLICELESIMDDLSNTEISPEQAVLQLCILGDILPSDLQFDLD